MIDALDVLSESDVELIMKINSDDRFLKGGNDIFLRVCACLYVCVCAGHFGTFVFFLIFTVLCSVPCVCFLFLFCLRKLWFVYSFTD